MNQAMYVADLGVRVLKTLAGGADTPWFIFPSKSAWLPGFERPWLEGEASTYGAEHWSGELIYPNNWHRRNRENSLSVCYLTPSRFRSHIAPVVSFERLLGVKLQRFLKERIQMIDCNGRPLRRNAGMRIVLVALFVIAIMNSYFDIGLSGELSEDASAADSVALETTTAGGGGVGVVAV